MRYSGSLTGSVPSAGGVACAAAREPPFDLHVGDAVDGVENLEHRDPLSPAYVIDESRPPADDGGLENVDVVGKTLLARSLAERMFGEKDAVIQIDMSEYMEKFTVSRLIGSPPGYVGHDEGGQLTEAVRRKPYSVVLFDEIEKAHPDVIQLLLQALEDGRLTDSLGRVVDFRNTIIILTSNVGADVLQRNNSVGFDVGVDSTRDYEKLKDRIMDETKRAFKPEFLNRLTDIVIFQQLAKVHMTKIVDIEVDKVAKRLLDLGVKLVVNEAARGYLVDNGWDEKYGARPLRRAVERLLEDPLAEAILRDDYNKEEPVIVSVGEKGLVFTQKKSGADTGA